MADRKRKILIVEDDPHIRLLIKITLQDTLEVYESSNGADALDFIRKQKVDIVISDVTMPVMDGYELVHALKEVPGTSGIPVLMLTAGNSRRGRDNPVYLPDDYLQKPFDVGELLQKVNALLK